MPGPVLAATIFYAAGSWGAWAGPLIMFGHVILELSVVVALGLGLTRWLKSPRDPLVVGVGLVGGVMLVWLGYDMLRSVPQLSLATIAATPSTFHPVAAGILLSASNPYFWIWWATVGLGLFAQARSQRGRSGVAAFYIGHYTADLVWYTMISVLIASGKNLMGDGPFRALIALCGLALVGFGVYFAISAARARWAPPPAAAD